MVAAGETALFRLVHFLENHSENSGGGLVLEGGGSGGGFKVTLVDCLLEGNVAEGPAGGGGINNGGAGGFPSVLRSALVDNQAAHQNGLGGGIRTSRAVVIDSSTVSGNQANSTGGGIHISSSACPGST